MIAIIGKKHGMTQVFDQNGSVMPVTVIEVEKNLVVAKKTAEQNGYEAVLLGHTVQKSQRLNKADLGQFPDGAAPRAYLKEMRDFSPTCEIGQELGLEVLEGVRYVDVAGVSKGKGFQGGMKRHGFGGGRKTHGSKFHRDLGSTGQAAWPSRTFKGQKMAGRMGGEQTTVQNLEVLRIEADRNLLVVRGAVPGPRGSRVIVRKAKKKA
ncbi:50S ribosomal protein L3 [Candidatus Haliotispira prima]|uniref:Large ribosomal subunit protein uL3 n=1 Tax=Candidatus Haliotispira prima TaxID=3034016 RepID=A0ABY8MG37_9SPIO|nr:50S ribosomal protein L3 [Candidatus Haliotispira prima]